MRETPRFVCFVLSSLTETSCNSDNSSCCNNLFQRFEWGDQRNILEKIYNAEETTENNLDRLLTVVKSVKKNTAVRFHTLAELEAAITKFIEISSSFFLLTPA